MPRSWRQVVPRNNKQSARDQDEHEGYKAPNAFGEQVAEFFPSQVFLPPLGGFELTPQGRIDFFFRSGITARFLPRVESAVWTTMA